MATLLKTKARPMPSFWTWFLEKVAKAQWLSATVKLRKRDATVMELIKKNWTILQSIILYCSLRRRGRSSPSPCSCLCSPTTSHVTKIRQTPWPWRQPSARRNKSFGACGGWSFCFWSLPRSFVAFIMCNTSHSVRRLASLRPSA